MKFDSAQRDDIGQRKSQQDRAASFSLPGGGQLLFLADGAGGMRGGEIASSLAIKAALELANGGVFDGGDISGGLIEIVRVANDRIREHGERNPKLARMGTTFVAAALDRHGLRWVSIGDSHLYLFRDGRLEKLNEEHTRAAELMAMGSYAPDDPKLDKYRHILVSALDGREEIDIIDIVERPRLLANGDLIVLASDGLDTLSHEQSEQALNDLGGEPAEFVARDLISRVLARNTDDQDNVTIQIVRINGLDEPGQTSVPPTRPSATASDRTTHSEEEDVTRTITPASRDRTYEQEPPATADGSARAGHSAPTIRDRLAQLPGVWRLAASLAVVGMGLGAAVFGYQSYISGMPGATPAWGDFFDRNDISRHATDRYGDHATRRESHKPPAMRRPCERFYSPTDGWMRECSYTR